MSQHRTWLRIREGIVVGATLYLLLCSALLAHATPITFAVTYNDGAGEGFNDPTLGAQRKAALQFAALFWGNLLQTSYVGETINVVASFDPLGGDANAAPLGQGGPSFTLRDFGAGVAGTFYPPALADHIARKTLPHPAGKPEDITVRFNSDVDGPAVFGANGFFYGNPGPGQGDVPAGDFDFVTIALHEIAHGLGFRTNIQADGSFQDGKPAIYDRFVQDAAKTHLDAMTDAQRQAAITAPLFWDSTHALEEEGPPFALYAPPVFDPLSSISHLDPDVFGTAMMLPGEGADSVTHSLIVPELRMLQDMGWDVTVPGPSSLALLALGVLCIVACGWSRELLAKRVRHPRQ